jgi:hypothetical protein
MPKYFDHAEIVENIASGLIPNYHSDLATARILYVFVSEASKRNGKEVLGKVQKVSGVTEWAIEKDFMVIVAQDKWQELTDSQRTALVDHLLERCVGEEDENTGDMKWKVRDPDVQEFSSILNRYGAWMEDLQNFVSVAHKINLDGLMEEGEEEEEEEEEEVQQTEE